MAYPCPMIEEKALLQTMELKSDETLLNGQWLIQGERIVADEVCRRIEWLIESQLESLATTGWETLYQDTRDGRLWERTYPQSEMHGGGPPQLSIVSPEIAVRKCGIKL